MAIVITKTGMPNRSMTLEEDAAEVLLEALAEVLGAKVQLDWTEPEPDAGGGTVYVARTK